MRASLPSIVWAASIVALSVADASASTVTWEAAGKISTVVDSFLPSSPSSLASIAVGTPWTLDITFNPDTPGVHISGCSAAQPVYRYPDAVTAARFQLGAFVYTNTRGDIYTNFDLPIGMCGSDGIVQFQWLGGWLGGAGGPDLNPRATHVGGDPPDLFALLLASYFDAPRSS